jgi:hypothetical protein
MVSLGIEAHSQNVHLVRNVTRHGGIEFNEIKEVRGFFYRTNVAIEPARDL